MSDDQEPAPETAMERFEEFARKVFSKKKPSGLDAEFPAKEPADNPQPEPPAKDTD
jgi:hypothetical protein